MVRATGQADGPGATVRSGLHATAAMLVDRVATAAILVDRAETAARVVGRVGTAAILVDRAETAARVVGGVGTAAILVARAETAARVVDRVATAAKVAREANGATAVGVVATPPAMDVPAAPARVGHAGKASAPWIVHQAGPTIARDTAATGVTVTAIDLIGMGRTAAEPIAGGLTTAVRAMGAPTSARVDGIRAPTRSDAMTATGANMAIVVDRATDHARVTAQVFAIDRDSETVPAAADARRAAARPGRVTVVVLTIGSPVRTARARPAPPIEAPVAAAAGSGTGIATARTVAATAAVAAFASVIRTAMAEMRTGADSATGRRRTSLYRRRSSAVIRPGSRASPTVRSFPRTSTRAAWTGKSGSSCGPWPAASRNRSR